MTQETKDAALREEIERLSKKERLLEELRIHQIELESQNQELRRTRGELESAMHRFTDLYDFAPVGYVTLDPNGVIHELNLACATMIGVERSRLLGHRLEAFVQFEPLDALRAHLENCANGPTRGELRMRPRDGDGIDLQIASMPVERDRKLVFRTSLTDISRVKQAERDALIARAEENHLRRQYELLDRLTLTLNRILGRTPYSAAAELHTAIAEHARLLVDGAGAGLAVIGADGVPVWTWTDPSARNEDLAREVLETGRARLSPHRMGVPLVFGGRARGALCVWRQSPPSFTEESQRTLEMLAERGGSALEIARLTALEVKQRSRLSVLARTGRVAQLSFDRERILSALADLPIPWLADLCLVFGIGSSSLLPVRAVHADARREHGLGEAFEHLALDRDDPNPFCRAWRTELLVRGELPQDGPLAEFLASVHASNLLAVPIASSNGDVEAIIGFVYTDSGRVYDEDDEPYAEELAQRAAMTIEQARLYAERGAAIRARDNLLAVVSHDLRSPLSAVRLSAGMLAQAPGVERRRTKKQVDVILRATIRMERLISDLLAAATIEGGAFTVERKPELVEDVLADLFSALEPLAAEKGVRLERHVEEGIPPLVCDRQRLLQALVNIAGNAIKFCKESGVVRVAARISSSNKSACVAVTDDGPGIPAEQLPKLFDRYWRARPSGRHGTGLGLFIAKGIIEAHGGTIEVTSRLGEGSTFLVNVPLTD